jgi:hypothetical protein
VNPTVILWKSRENRSSTESGAAGLSDLIYQRRSAPIRCRKVPQKQMRPGPATRAASFVDLNPCLPAARSGETTVLVRQRPRRVPHLPVLAAEHDSENMIRRTASLQPLRWPAAQPAQGASRRGGRNARATGLRSRAFPISPSNSPSRIASCHRRHRNHHPASFEISTFRCTHSQPKYCDSQPEKHFPLCRSCGR